MIELCLPPEPEYEIRHEQLLEPLSFLEPLVLLLGESTVHSL